MQSKRFSKIKSVSKIQSFALRSFVVLFLFLIVHNRAECKLRQKEIISRSFCVMQTGVPVTVLANVADSGLHRKHRLIAALLAFPFPLGMLGLHRIYLNASPLIPLAYIATFGGIVGVIPFIDFVLILVCKDVNIYAHRNSLFMWSRMKQ